MPSGLDVCDKSETVFSYPTIKRLFPESSSKEQRVSMLYGSDTTGAQVTGNIERRSGSSHLVSKNSSHVTSGAFDKRSASVPSEASYTPGNYRGVIMQYRRERSKNRMTFMEKSLEELTAKAKRIADKPPAYLHAQVQQETFAKPFTQSS